jgi:hypothetical protein
MIAGHSKARRLRSAQPKVLDEWPHQGSGWFSLTSLANATPMMTASTANTMARRRLARFMILGGEGMRHPR